MEKIQQYSEDTQRQRLLKAYPQEYLKGIARSDYLDGKYDTKDRKRNEEIAVNELVGMYLNNLARIEIQQQVAKRINRIKQQEEKRSSNNAVRKLPNNKEKIAKLRENNYLNDQGA